MPARRLMLPSPGKVAWPSPSPLLTNLQPAGKAPGGPAIGPVHAPVRWHSWLGTLSVSPAECPSRQSSPAAASGHWPLATGILRLAPAGSDPSSPSVPGSHHGRRLSIFDAHAGRHLEESIVTGLRMRNLPLNARGVRRFTAFSPALPIGRKHSHKRRHHGHVNLH